MEGKAEMPEGHLHGASLKLWLCGSRAQSGDRTEMGSPVLILVGDR